MESNRKKCRDIKTSNYSAYDSKSVDDPTKYDEISSRTHACTSPCICALSAPKASICTWARACVVCVYVCVCVCVCVCALQHLATIND